MAADSLVGDGLKDSPYSELKAKYEVLQGYYLDECARERRSYERLRECEEKYEELLYGVARKWPGETRHQTALRYIRQTEQLATAAGVGTEATTPAVTGSTPPA